MSVLAFYKTHQVPTQHRSELYTVPTILAVCGGLLGLFLGISTLSIFELIYFFTLRLYWNIRRLKFETNIAAFKAKIIHFISHK